MRDRQPAAAARITRLYNGPLMVMSIEAEARPVPRRFQHIHARRAAGCRRLLHGEPGRDRDCHRLASDGADVWRQPRRSEHGDDRVHADAGRVHPGERMGGGSTGRQNGICVGDRPVHAGLDSLRHEQRSLGVHRGQNSAGHGRRADGARRQAGRAADDGEEGSGALDRLHHVARTGRAGHRSAGRRLHHHLFLVALDFLFERAARHHRHRPRAALDQERARARPAVRLAGICAGRIGVHVDHVLAGASRTAERPLGDGRIVSRIRRGRRLGRRVAHAPHGSSAHPVRRAQTANVCHRHLGRLAVPAGDQRVAVSPPAHVSDRVRPERLSIRAAGAGDVRRQSVHEAGDHSHSSRLRLPASVGRQRADHGGVDRVLRLADARTRRRR